MVQRHAESFPSMLHLPNDDHDTVQVQAAALVLQYRSPQFIFSEALRQQTALEPPPFWQPLVAKAVRQARQARIAQASPSCTRDAGSEFEPFGQGS